MGAEHEPQPGAIAAPYVPNGLPPVDLTHDGWPTLPGYEAVNFVSAEPRLWAPAETVYRVWGAPASEYSKYWSPTNVPDSVHEFYGGEAVESSWNSGVYVASVTIEFLVHDVPPKGAPVWYGISARQPASDIHGVALPHSKYHLPGGAEQIYIDPSLLRKLNTASPWSERPAPAAAADPVSAPVRDTPPPADPLARQYWDLGHTTSDLAALLLSAGHAPLHAQAMRLQQDADKLIAEAPHIPDPAALAHSHRSVVGLIGIARHLHPFHASAAEANRISVLLQEVVERAHALDRSSS